MVVSLQHLRPPGSDPPAQQAAALVFCSLAVTKKTTAISSLLLSLSQEPTDENERGEEGFCSETTSHNSQTRTEKRLQTPPKTEAGWERRKKGRRKIGGAHRGKMVISAVGLTPFAHKIDGMAHA
jgi:hypothetical protein